MRIITPQSHHQQAPPRPPMVVSMAQPPPVSMQGLGNIAPMMGPAGGMPMLGSQPMMTDSGDPSQQQQQQQQPYHHHHPHHHHTAPPPPQNPHHPSAPPPRHPLPPHHPQSHNPGPGQYQHPPMAGSQNAMPPPPHSSNPNPPYQMSCVGGAGSQQPMMQPQLHHHHPQGPSGYSQNPARYQHPHLQPQQQPPPQQQQQQPYHNTMHEMQPAPPPQPHPYQQQQQQQYNPVPTHSMQQQPKSPQPMVAHHHHHPHHMPQHHQQPQSHHHHQPMQPQQQQQPPPPQAPPPQQPQPRSHHMASNSMVGHSSHQQPPPPPPPQTMQPQPAPPPTHHMQHHHPHHHYQNTQPPPPPQPASHSMMHCSYPDNTLVQQPQPWLQPQQQPSNISCPPGNQDRGVNQLNKIESVHFNTMSATVDCTRNIPPGPNNIPSGPPSNIPPVPSNISSGPSNISSGSSNISSGPSNISSGPSNISSGPNISSVPSNISSGPSNITSGPSNILHSSSPSNNTSISSIHMAPSAVMTTTTPSAVPNSALKPAQSNVNKTTDAVTSVTTHTATATSTTCATSVTTVTSTSGSVSPTSSSCSSSSSSTTAVSVSSPAAPTSPGDDASNTSAKEKTPMCLVNELARYNKIQHQYCLTDEKGPAHKKAFTVTLHLGTSEQYKASGPSIKKAQHSAAQRALLETQYKHPPPKPAKVVRQSKLTPTVELNALAMKRGEAAQYTFLETPPLPLPHPLRMGPFGPPHLPPPLPHTVPPNLRALYHQKYFGRPMVVPVYLVSLKVGDREWVGEGGTAQQAKHNAADKALRIMKSLPIPQDSSAVSDSSTEDGNADLKSPISCVHEVALRRSLTVQFEVVGESGPPHMRTFLTSCVVGATKCQGEGASKKISKKRAAELMLDELRKLPPLPPTSPARMKRKIAPKKKCRNLVKEQTAPDYGQNINPISRLIQIQQSRKQREPVYTLIAEKGVPRRREFVMQVEVGDYTAQGTGPNKKLAKRAAAESVLQQMGFTKPAPQPAKSAIKSADSDADKQEKAPRKVTFQEEEKTTTETVSVPTSPAARQIVPGLIVLSPPAPETPGDAQHLHNTAAVAKEILKTNHDAKAAPNFKPPAGEDGRRPEGKKPRPGNSKAPPSEASTPAPDGGKGASAEPCVTNDSTAPLPPASAAPAPSAPSSTPETAPPPLVPGVSTTPGGVRPKDQLKYLAQILGLQIQFTDFPKGNKSEYLSLVSLNTSPPHVSHGHGPTVESAHDQACKAALTTLAEMGLDDVASGD